MFLGKVVYQPRGIEIEILAPAIKEEARLVCDAIASGLRGEGTINKQYTVSHRFLLLC